MGGTHDDSLFQGAPSAPKYEENAARSRFLMVAALIL
jgi:hypothetical protein